MKKQDKDKDVAIAIVLGALELWNSGSVFTLNEMYFICVCKYDG